MFHIFFMSRYSRQLEESSFRGQTADFAWLILYSSVSLLVCFIVPLRPHVLLRDKTRFFPQRRQIRLTDSQSTDPLTHSIHAVPRLPTFLLSSIHLGATQPRSAPIVPRVVRIHRTVPAVGSSRILTVATQHVAEGRPIGNCCWPHLLLLLRYLPTHKERLEAT